jgi:hypothetical protein
VLEAEATFVLVRCNWCEINIDTSCPVIWTDRPHGLTQNFNSKMENTVRLTAVFWVDALCCVVEVYRRFRDSCCFHYQGDDGGSKHLWNVGKLLPDYTAQQPGRQPSSYSPPWEPEISNVWLTALQRTDWRKCVQNETYFRHTCTSHESNNARILNKMSELFNDMTMTSVSNRTSYLQTGSDTTQFQLSLYFLVYPRLRSYTG